WLIDCIGSIPSPHMHSSHRRNVSDTSGFSSKDLVQLVNTDNTLHTSNSLSSQNTYTGSKGWNPFEEDFRPQTTDISVDDQTFGHEFDKIRKGSQSSISNVKSREDLVMSSATPEADPFGSAPFDPQKMRRHKEKQDLLKLSLDKPHDLNDFNLLSTNTNANKGISVPTTYMPLYSSDAEEGDDPNNGNSGHELRSLPVSIPLRNRKSSETSTTTSQSTVASNEGSIRANPFAKAPAEDRSKYEKFFDADPDDDPECEGERDSIGSASDLRDSEETPDDGIDEDEDDEDFAQEVTAIEIKLKEPSRGSKPKPTLISSDDLLIGHVDGDKPLLCEEEDDSSPQVIHIAGASHHMPSLSTLSNDVFASAPFRKPHSKAKKKSDKTDMESEDIRLVETTTSGDEIDEEVARNLRAQVVKDSMVGPKDLFGSKPFTEQQLVTCEDQHQSHQKQYYSEQQVSQQSTSSQKPLNNEQQFPRLVALPYQQRMVTNEQQIQLKTQQQQPPQQTEPSKPSQDLFGAIPFASNSTATQVIAPLPPPNVVTQRPTVPPKTTKVLAATTSPPKKVIVHQTATASIPTQSSESTLSPPSPIKAVKPIVKSKPKSKVLSKTAKKYEVEDDDDEIDGLISCENDEEVLDTKKWRKKDKKEKSEKKEKTKEKSDKSKEKTEKSKDKSEKVKEKDKSKDKSKKSKDKDKSRHQAFANMSFEDVTDDT
ncbi:unnamed protein product, partial [Oppiella nova]